MWVARWDRGYTERVSSIRVALTLGSCLAALWLGACGSSEPRSGLSPAAHEVRSNVLRADHAGSQACATCHADIFEQWLSSPMRRMTRQAALDEIRAPFDGARFDFGDGHVEMTTEEGRRYVRLRSERRGHRLYRVTKVIGGRHREDYVGIRVRGTGERDRAYVASPTQLVLPVSYVYSPGEWRPKGYSVMVHERPGLAAGPVWNRTCIFCHNTVPYLSTIFDDLGDIDRPRYQGSVPSNLLPPERQVRFEITDERALRRALSDEIRFLGGEEEGSEAATTDELLLRALRTTQRNFDAEHLVEVGIGCESCHGGSREHVEDPSRRPSYRIRSDFMRAEVSGSGSRAQWINHSCARCHSVLFSRYPHTWEGGQRSHEPGGSNINSGEARDFLLGGCAEQLACTSCHDPHAEDSRARLDALATPAGNAVCVRCHTGLAQPQAVRAHTHHQPDGAGGVCINCHMPRKNMGLDYGMTRYHRIGSPNDRARVERDRPLECSLCHADRSVEELVSTMESWWGTRYDRAALRSLYGPDLGARTPLATLAHGHAHERAVAMDILARAGDRAALPVIARELGSEYPLVRYFAREALGRLAGERPPLDMTLSGDALTRQAEQWLREREARQPVE